MEDNNNSPYEYEKPLRPRQSKRLGFVAGLGLFGVGTVLSSGAFASGFLPSTNDVTEQPETTDASFVPATDPTADAAIQEATNVQAKQVRVPLARVEKSKKASLSIPALPKTDFANTSNATQAAGTSTGSGSSAGNVSSSTPSSGSGSSAGSGSNAGSGSSSGNVSSSTPSAGSGSGSSSNVGYEREGQEDREEHESGDDD